MSLQAEYAIHNMSSLNRDVVYFCSYNNTDFKSEPYKIT